MSGLIKTLVEQSKVPFYVDYRTGSVRSLTGLAASADPVVTGTPRFTQTSLGRALSSRTGLLTYAHQADQLLLTQTLFAFGEFNDAVATTQYIASKRQPAVGQNWVLNVSAPKTFGYDSSATVSTTGGPLVRTVSWTHVSGVQAKAYQNGNPATTTALVSTIPQFAASISIGGYAAAGYVQAPLYAFLVVNEALDDADIARLHRELVAAPGVVRRPTKSFSIPHPVKTPAEYAAENVLFDLRGDTVSGKMVDVASGTYPATVVGPWDVVKGGPFTNGVRLSTAYGDFPAATDNEIFQGEYSVEAWMEPKNTSAGVAVALSGISQNYVGRTGNAMFTSHRSAAGAQVTTTGVNGWVVAGVPTHFVWTLGISGQDVTVKMYANGVMNRNQSHNTGFSVFNINSILNSYSTAAGFKFNAVYHQVRYYKNRVLTLPEIRAKYLKGARKCLLDASVHADGSCPVSLAARSSGEIANGWRISSGTWKVVEDAPSGGKPGKRRLECTTNGLVYRKDSSCGFGSWLLQIYHTGSMRNGYLNFASDRVAGVNLPAGYSLVTVSSGAFYLRKNVVGGHINLLITPNGVLVPDTWYSFWIKRRLDGEWTVWLKGGAYSTWTLAPVSSGSNPVTDITYTALDYACMDMTSVSAIGNFRRFLGEMTPTEAIAAGVLEL